ncbi:MAG: hypothetical protein IJ105_03690 [Bacilli bacterium]|nr:hypothetical protein [Bacilli bacterium]
MKINKNIILYLLLFILFIIPINVFATGGGLRKSSIKTCPNGITYGLHSDGNGGTHWHVAATNGNGYFAKGDAIYSDPCPGHNTNQGTAGQTSGSNNYNNSMKNDSTNNVNKEVVKSSDVSIKSIKIEDDIITNISDVMEYEVTKKSISIYVVLNDIKSKYEIEGNTDNLSKTGINKVKIKVTAENDNEKTYELNIKRKVIESNVVINEFKVNDSVIEFENKKGSTFVFYWTKKFDYDYILSDSKSTLKLFNNGKEIKNTNLKVGYNKYELVIIDEDGNENDYKLEIQRISIIGSIILTILSIGFFALIAIAIVMLLKYKKKKNSRKY